MNKNKSINQKLWSKSNVALFTAVCMIIGFIASRALLSISMILFGFNAIRDVHPREWLKQKWWLMAVLWLSCFALSWFWSDDTSYWWEHLQVKMPILLLPLAFGFLPRFTIKQLSIFTFVLCCVLLTGAAYTIYFLSIAPGYYIEQYGYAHVLPTIPKNDHVRFSICTAAGIAWCVFIIPCLKGWLKWLTIISATLFSIYLHILAARTGLLAFYIFLAGWSIWLITRKRSLWKNILIAILLIGCSVAAFMFVPTLKEKIGYVKYTIWLYKNDGKLYGQYSDMGRIISYDIAQKIIRQHPLTGVGAGDMMTEMKKGYAIWYPDVLEENKLVPHNQLLANGLAAGLPCIVLFLVWLIWPLFELKKNRSGFFFFMVWCMLLVLLMAEPALEVQFGVFVYLFFLLWQRHAMLKEPVSEDWQ